jgi:hypothetical protein
MRHAPPMAMKTIVQPHASAWGISMFRNTPTLTHGANREKCRCPASFIITPGWVTDLPHNEACSSKLT